MVLHTTRGTMRGDERWRREGQHATRGTMGGDAGDKKRYSLYADVPTACSIRSESVCSVILDFKLGVLINPVIGVALSIQIVHHDNVKC